MNLTTHPISPIRGWVPLLVLPAGVLTFIPPGSPRWLMMWLLALTIFVACKWLTWRRVSLLEVSWQFHVAYLFAWPGLDAERFLSRNPRIHSPCLREWMFGVAKALLGGALFWLVARQVPGDEVLLRGWMGLVGLAFLLHFGVFHLLSCFWRSPGMEAWPLMNWPILATSVSDFWGRRWNMAFRDLTYRFLFQPLTRVCGPRAAIFAGFVMSGLVHDLVISVPAGGGYGLPTLHFVIQGLGLLAERSRTSRSLGLGSGWRGWLFTMFVSGVPAYGLFHPAFVYNVVVPFMKAAGALD